MQLRKPEKPHELSQCVCDPDAAGKRMTNMSQEAQESPAGSSEALPAHTFNEVRYYLMVTPCPECGKGPWVSQQDPSDVPPVGVTTVAVQCGQCARSDSFVFDVERETAISGSGSLEINPTDEPSAIIDLGQWLSLFYLLVESASSESSAPLSRRMGYQAALCLGEALKFYGDNELPPESAFFVRAATFHEHPENFARQKLCDMLAKLPAMPRMARRVERDERATGGKWWRFWRPKR